MASLGSYKLSPAQHWDSDSNPYGFNDWIKEMSSLVRTLRKGDILENFLDEKLKRVAKHSSLMSKVLLDDEDFHNDAITAIIGEAERSSTSILVTTQTLGAARAEHKYKDFDPETIELDQRLYSVLHQCIKGSRAAILEQVICPSYVQAVIVFHQHLNLSASDRKVRALDSISTLRFSGDTHLYQIEATKRIRELMDSRCTMEDWILFVLMRSFDAGHEHIQYQLAEVINKDRQPGNTNFFELITKYMSMIQCVTVQNKSLGINMMKEDKSCSYCGKKGHLEVECYTKKRDEGQGKSSKGPCTWPHEAEQLMGLPKDCTAGARISARDRLQAIGNGWDVNVVKMLLRFSKLVSAATREKVSKQSQLANVESNVEPTVELSETDRLHQAALTKL